MKMDTMFLNRPLGLEWQAASVLARELMAGRKGLFEDGGLRQRDGPQPQLYEDIAVIEIRGLLVPGSVYCPEWGICGYDAIRALLASAVNAEQARKIILLIDSPGGVASGCFDLADAIYRARQVKPIVAICADSAYSAAYALASAASVITVPRDGGVGSIGVITLHTDMTGALEKEGIKVTAITYGKYKGEKAPTTSLSEGALGRIQAEVDYLGDLFVETVARNRGLSLQKVKGTEAGTFLGPYGVEAGLADFVLAVDEAFLFTRAYKENRK